MSSTVSCPRCHMDVAQERVQSEVIVCNHCGYTHNIRDEELELTGLRKDPAEDNPRRAGGAERDEGRHCRDGARGSEQCLCLSHRRRFYRDRPRC